MKGVLDYCMNRSARYQELQDERIRLKCIEPMISTDNHTIQTINNYQIRMHVSNLKSHHGGLLLRMRQRYWSDEQNRNPSLELPIKSEN
jgi:hypothetical protein